jgi:hypothetical protein
VKIEHRSGGNIGGEGRRMASPQSDPEGHAALQFEYVTTTAEAMTYGPRRRHSKLDFRNGFPMGDLPAGGMVVGRPMART